MTGGGIVDHRNDWTYALILHSSVSAASTSATDLYAQIHHAISLSLDEIGIDSRPSPCPRCSKETPVASEIPRSLLYNPRSQRRCTRPDGQKIAGAAMEKSRQGLLTRLT